MLEHKQEVKFIEFQKPISQGSLNQFNGCPVFMAYGDKNVIIITSGILSVVGDGNIRVDNGAIINTTNVLYMTVAMLS